MMTPNNRQWSIADSMLLLRSSYDMPSSSSNCFTPQELLPLSINGTAGTLLLSPRAGRVFARKSKWNLKMWNMSLVAWNWNGLVWLTKQAKTSLYTITWLTKKATHRCSTASQRHSTATTSTGTPSKICFSSLLIQILTSHVILTNTTYNSYYIEDSLHHWYTSRHRNRYSIVNIEDSLYQSHLVVHNQPISS